LSRFACKDHRAEPHPQNRRLHPYVEEGFVGTLFNINSAQEKSPMIPARLYLPALLAAAACLLLAPVHAAAGDGPARISPYTFHGFYAGALAGLATFDSELDYAGNSTEGLAATGLSNGVFVGSGTVYEGVYFAVEGNLAFHNADFSENLGAFGIEADVEETYGVSGRIGGFPAQELLAYVRGGWQEVNIDVSDNTGWSEDKRFDGVRLGLGVEYQTNQNVFLRGEYSYTLYHEQTLNGGGAEYEIDPDAGLFQLGLGYRF
jgi:outer membrane immunogenic protein